MYKSCRIPFIQWVAMGQGQLVKNKRFRKIKKQNHVCNIELEKGQIILHIQLQNYSLFNKGIPRIYPSNDKNGNKSSNTQQMDERGKTDHLGVLILQ